MSSTNNEAIDATVKVEVSWYRLGMQLFDQNISDQAYFFKGIATDIDANWSLEGFREQLDFIGQELDHNQKSTLVAMAEEIINEFTETK